MQRHVSLSLSLSFFETEMNKNKRQFVFIRRSYFIFEHLNIAQLQKVYGWITLYFI